VDVATIPVPTTEAEIGTLRVPISPADESLLAADEPLVASASIIADFENSYLEELTVAVGRSLKALRQMVVSRLRATATNAEPIAASAARRVGQFANPWHDELGQFAPKGYGTDRPISHAEGTWSVEAADGSKIEMGGDGADELTDVQRSDALNAVADAWDLAPLDKGGPPRIEVHASDHHPLDIGTTSDVLAWVHANEAPVIHLIGARAEWDTPYETDQPMPSEREISKIRYTATHEYGHLHMYANEMDEWHNVINLYSKREVRNDLSEYGRDTPVEAYAEAFAEYFGTAGSTHNAAALRFAADLGWRNELPNRGMAAAMPGRLDEIPVSIYETATGPIYEYADGTIVDMSGTVGSTGLVAAGFDLPDYNVMTPEEWAAAFAIEAADIVGDVVVDAATGQALRPGINVSDKVITDLIDKHIGRLTDLGPLVQTSIRDALALAVQEQLSLDDVIREMQATGPLGETAARTIARTELTAATNGGMLTGWKRDGLPFKKWVALHDLRTRHAHMEADGQVVPTEQQFEVGGWPAQYPGDPSLPVHLRINCRCYMDRIGQDGQTIDTRLVDATRAELYSLAQELNIPGRSKMRKDDLFQAIDRYRNGFGYQPLEDMTRAQLLIRARTAGIVGRHRMTKPELMVRLRDLATGRNRDRWLIDAGHGTREQLAAVQAQLTADIAALHQAPLVGAGPPPNAEKIDTIRRRVFRRYGGGDTGTAMCVGCGARLHWSNNTQWEQLTMLRINEKLAWSSKNAMPACLACAPKLSMMTRERIASTFSIDQSWSAIANKLAPGWGDVLAEFANPWHDEVGKFAPKGTGTNFASIKGRIKAAFAAGATYQGFTGADSTALLDKFNGWAKQMSDEDPNFYSAPGTTHTALAITSTAQEGNKGLLGTSPNGITGAVSYEFTPATGETEANYHINWLGSTGIAPGVGTQLTAQVLRNAATNNASVSLVVSDQEGTPEFWEGLGFVTGRDGYARMSASDVAQWVENVK
jgi:hypothetical protein